MVKDCPDAFKDAPVKGFCNSTMLRSVVGGEAALSALLLCHSFTGKDLDSAVMTTWAKSILVMDYS
jgi:hypothetical protein